LPPQRRPAPAKINTNKRSPGNETESDEDATTINELEKSRVRTAQAARMALERAASAYSEDEESSTGRGAAQDAGNCGSPTSDGLSSPGHGSAYSSELEASEYLHMGGRARAGENRPARSNGAELPMTPPRGVAATNAAQAAKPASRLWKPFKVFRAAEPPPQLQPPLRAAPPSRGATAKSRRRADSGSEEDYVTYASDDNHA
jgi:hypothetical protein